MLSADHLDNDGQSFPIKCMRKFRSALGGEVTYRGVCVFYRLYFECVHIETTDNIDFCTESAVCINYKVYGITPGITYYESQPIYSIRKGEEGCFLCLF